MTSPNTFDPIAIAIEICTKDIFKLEVFSGIYSHQDTQEGRKRSWDEKVETVTGSLLEDYPYLEQSEQEAVIGAVFTIAFRMLTWIEFYMGTFDFSRGFCVEFLDPALFTREGVIDCRRVEAKMSEKTPTDLQRFLLASFYCQWRAIPELFNNLSILDKNLVYNANEPELIRQPDIIKFWSYHTMGESDKLKENNMLLDQFRLKAAITSGSQLAVDYCVERTRSRQSCLTDIAVSLFRHRVHREIRSDEHMNIVDDWIVFRNKTYNCAEESWVPDNFFTDIFYSLISAMSQPQKLDFWRQVYSIRFILSDKRIKHLVYVKVFEGFLCWPYQEMFLEFWKTSWPRLSLSVFSLLLLNVIRRIEPERGQFWYGEEKLNDYRKLLMDLWIDSPKDAKKRLFLKYSNKIFELFKSLYNLKTFSERDRRNIKVIIESATENKGFPHILSDSGFNVAIMLLVSKRVDLFEELVSSCFITPEEVRDYKLKTILIKSKKECLEFVRSKKWDKAEESLKWSEYELYHEDLLAIKNMLISCKDGLQTCIALWKSDPDLADQFVRWCVPPEEVPHFKYILISGEIGQKEIRELCISNTEIADNFVSWCLPPESHEYFKGILIHQVGSICMCTKYVLKDDTPELADKLIEWCLPEHKRKKYKKWLGHCKIEVFPTFKSNFKDIESCTDDEFPDKLLNWEPASKLISWCFAAGPDGTKDVAAGPDETKEIAVGPDGVKTIAFDPEKETNQTFGIEDGVIIVSDVEIENRNSVQTETITPKPEGAKSTAPEPEGVNSAINLEEETKFKRSFLKKSRREIIYKCIESNNWKVADRFLSWLNLDPIGLRTVKTEQICSDTETGELFSDLLSREKTDPKFAETGGKQRTIERFIHWFLVDEISIIKEFIMRLNRYGDDPIVQNIIEKLKQSDDIEAIKGHLMTF